MRAFCPEVNSDKLMFFHVEYALYGLRLVDWHAARCKMLERLQQVLPNSEWHFADHMGDMRRWTVRVQSFLARHS